MEKIEGQLQDSLTIGSASKEGAIKLYCDFTKEKDTKERIDKAIKARTYMQEKITKLL